MNYYKATRRDICFNFRFENHPKFTHFEYKHVDIIVAHVMMKRLPYLRNCPEVTLVFPVHRSNEIRWQIRKKTDNYLLFPT